MRFKAWSRAARTALNPHEYAIDQRRITVSFKYWRAAFYGSPLVFLVSPIFIANRRSIVPTPCRGGDYIAEDVLFHSCFGKSLISVRMFALSVWFYERWSATKSLRKYDMHDTLYPRFPRDPISRFSAPSTAYFACPLIFANLYMYASRARRRENVSRACSAKYGGGLYTLKQGRNLHMSIYGRFIVLRVTI